MDTKKKWVQAFCPKVCLIMLLARRIYRYAEYKPLKLLKDIIAYKFKPSIMHLSHFLLCGIAIYSSAAAPFLWSITKRSVLSL